MRRRAGLIWPARLIGKRRRPVDGDACKIVLTGRFDSKNWILNHLGPLSASKKCSHLWMVSTNPVPRMPNVVAIYPAKWLTKVLGATKARLLTFMWVAIRKRPHVVGGFHIVCNGIAAAIVGSLVGVRTMYFCVGGPAEVQDGGIHSADSLFTGMEAADAVVERRFIKIISKFDTIITMGTRAVDFFREKGIDTDFHVVSGGIDPKQFYPSEEKPSIDLIMTGRIVPVKRIDILLHAIRIVVDELPNVRLAIVGGGELRDELSSEFVGYQDDLVSWLQKSKIFVLTSDSEGLALSMMEAMMSGLPAVVSDVGDLGDLVENGVNGYLVPRRSPEKSAARIVELLTDEQKLGSFSQAARRSALQYETEAMIQRWDNILAGFRNISGPEAIGETEEEDIDRKE